MLNGILRKRVAQGQPVAITVEEGQGLPELEVLQKHNPSLYALAVVLRISFFLALVLKSLTLWHW